MLEMRDPPRLHKGHCTNPRDVCLAFEIYHLDFNLMLTFVVLVVHPTTRNMNVKCKVPVPYYTNVSVLRSS